MVILFRLFLVLMLSLGLASCGGGAGADAVQADPDPAAGASPSAPPAPEAPPAPPGDTPATPPTGEPQARIEPYERTAAMATKDASPSWGRSKADRPVAPIRLGPLSTELEQVQAKALGGPAVAGQARQIGVGRAIAQTARVSDTALVLDWQRGADGRWVGAASFQSEAAAGIRLALRVDRLPERAWVHAYPVAGGRVESVEGKAILAAIERNRQAGDASESGRTYWLPTVAADHAVLQIELPDSLDPAAVDVAIPYLSHLWWTPAGITKADGLKLGRSGACNQDATCSPDYDSQAASIARLEFMKGQAAYLCSGTLMADAARTGEPYLLTANHCIGDQTVASSLSTYWFYRARECGGDAIDPRASRVNGGASLHHASATTDTAFLRLAGSPPAGTVHAGSLLVGTEVGTALVGLHHPQGDPLKLSLGTNLSQAECSLVGCYLSDGDSPNFIGVTWSQGTTEGGSSGSPVFASVGSQRYVVGQLFGGGASCNMPHLPDYYGRFDKAYPALRDLLARKRAGP